jgi:hypothetical protein
LIASTRTVRRVLAPVLLALYGLPSGVAVASDVAHAAQHVAEAMREHRQTAASLGLTHGQPVGDVRDGDSRREGQTPFVHTHGGSTHSHDGRAAGLLFAADSGMQSSSDVITPTPSVGPHVIPVRSAGSLADALRELPRAGGFQAATSVALDLTVPPPRV